MNRRTPLPVSRPHTTPRDTKRNETTTRYARRQKESLPLGIEPGSRAKSMTSSHTDHYTTEDLTVGVDTNRSVWATVVRWAHFGICMACRIHLSEFPL